MTGINNLLYSQNNLVPNFSFENYSVCPVGAPSSNFYEPYPWFNPTINTPDYYNQCNNSTNGTAGVPCNWTGCQNARTGQGYAGCALYYPTANGRDYIEVRFISPLRAGSLYCVEFYTSRAGKGLGAVDRIGAYLSVDSIYSNNLFVLPCQPQIENTQGNIIYDSTNWVLISGTYTASGGEKFLTIGNFYPDSLTQADSMGGPNIFAYYYIDDVRVYCCDADSCENKPEEFFIPTAFSPNGDGNNDVLHVRGPVKEMNFYIYDRWGEEVYHGTDPMQGWDGNYKGQKLNSGVFVYYFRGKLFDGTDVTQKGNITLVR